MKNYFSRINTSLKPFLNGLWLFLGILFLGLMSCSSPTDSTSSSPSSPTKDKTPPTVIINSDTLIEEIPAYLSFTFSEEVNGFTPDDIQFLTNEANGVNAAKSNFVTNNLMNYSLEITPKAIGTLYVSIPANSFYDLSGNQNDKPYSNSFTVISSNTTTHTISFKLNGGSFISSQITNLKVVDNTAIEETRLGGILSYPPTGPKPSIQAVTRGIFEWRTNAIKYELSNLVISDLTLEAVWSNSCGKVETFHPANRDALKNYVDAAVVAANATTNLNHIDTSAITDMNDLFWNRSSFNGEIGCWNTANVTDMSSIFKFAESFNQDISTWNVANVNNMSYMFFNATAFNQDISSWNVGNVTSMNQMFYNASAFNQDISSWNVANITTMLAMFNNASAFNQDIGSWNVANVTSMLNMFYNATAFNQDISRWNVANVNNMSGMFNSATNFDQDLSSWSVSNVTTYIDIFTGSAMESKTAKHPRFLDKTPPTVNINSDTLIEEIPAYLSFTFSEEVNGFTPDDIQILTNEANGVNAAKGSFVTNNLTNYSLEITPETKGTLYVNIPANSFEDLSANQNDKPYSNSFTVLDSTTTTHTISFKLNGGSFISSQITNLKVVSNTAIEETKLGGILSYPPTGPKPSIQAVTRDIFEWRNNDTKYDFSTPVSSDLTLEAVWSNSCGKVETFHPTNRNAIKTYTDAALGANSTTNLNHIDTSAITDMNDLFWNRSSFNGEIGCWNTAKVTDMNNMFNNAQVFNQDISSWNVANVTNMSWMFFDSRYFNQDISSWSVSNVTDTRYMFSGEIFFIHFNQDIGSWNVSSVTNMRNMFAGASAFNGDISSWNVANVTDMQWMFYYAYAFNQDISSWNVANVNNMRSMFKDATNFDQNLSSWSVNNVTNYDNMFTGSPMVNETNKHPVFNKP